MPASWLVVLVALRLLQTLIKHVSSVCVAQCAAVRSKMRTSSADHNKSLSLVTPQHRTECNRTAQYPKVPPQYPTVCNGTQQHRTVPARLTAGSAEHRSGLVLVWLLWLSCSSETCRSRFHRSNSGTARLRSMTTSCSMRTWRYLNRIISALIRIIPTRIRVIRTLNSVVSTIKRIISTLSNVIPTLF